MVHLRVVLMLLEMAMAHLGVMGVWGVERLRGGGSTPKSTGEAVNLVEVLDQRLI